MIITQEIITKEEAKRRIDESPGEFVVWNVIQQDMSIYQRKNISKIQSKEMIDLAMKIIYQDNNCFGVLSLEMEKKLKEAGVINNLLFPQRE